MEKIKIFRPFRVFSLSVFWLLVFPLLNSAVAVTDDFERSDSAAIGNGWIEKGAGLFFLSSGEVVKAAGGNYIDNIVYRAGDEALLDMEASLEFRLSGLPATYPQLHFRVDSQTVEQPGTLDSYLFWLKNGNTARLSRQDGSGGHATLAVAGLTEAVVPGQGYRIRLTAEGENPVVLQGYIERRTGTVWTEIGYGYYEDSSSNRKGAGTVGFSYHSLNYTIYENFIYGHYEGLNPNVPDNASLMCLGDSITEGFADVPELWGYRDHLQEMVGVGNYTFVGPYSNPYQHSIYSVYHAGVDGNTTSEMIDRLPSLLYEFFPPGIKEHSGILIHAGTNDISHNVPVEDIVDNFEDMIFTIDVHHPAIDIYVALIIPRSDDKNDETIEYNEALKMRLESLQATKQNLYIVDINTTFIDNLEEKRNC